MTPSLDLAQRLRAWTYRRQSLGRAAGDPAQALRSVVAVYSSHPTAPLALLGRSAAFEPASLGELEQRRDVVRLPGMRQSIFLMPAKTAPRIFAATRLPMEQHARRLRYAGLDTEAYTRLKRRVLELAREPMAATDLQKALKANQAERAEGDSTEDVRIMAGVRIMTSEGLVLRQGTSLRTDSLRYVATEAWLGHPLEEADAAQSLAWLAEVYLRGYGPARVEDFAWWCGVTRRRATEALRAIDTIDIGDGLLLSADQQADFASIEPLNPEAIDILPKWDAYTMGYAPDGRQRLVTDEHLRRAYSSGGGGTLAGDGLPLMLRGGRAVATWSHRFVGNRMQVTVTPFESGPLPASRYERAFDEAGRLLGAAAVEIAVSLQSN